MEWLKDNAFEFIICLILLPVAGFGVQQNWELMKEYSTNPDYLRTLAGTIFFVVLYYISTGAADERVSKARSGISPRLPKILFRTRQGHAIKYNKRKREFFCNGKSLTVTKPWSAEKVVPKIEWELIQEGPFEMEAAQLGCFTYRRTLTEETFKDGPEAIYYDSGHFKVTFDPINSTLTFSIQSPQARRVGQG